jgi:uncharacterized repeat protein (TIGR02543 family)
MNKGKDGKAVLAALLCAGLLVSGCKDFFHPEGPSESSESPVQYTVIFDADGGNPDRQERRVNRGSSIMSMLFESGRFDIMPEEPVKSGYIFGGWYMARNGGGNFFTPDTPVNGDITVYAWWVSSPQGDIPAGLTATAVSSDSITVSWFPVSGAYGYEVYRATSSAGSYSPAGYSESTSYTDAGLSSGTTYYYKVSAYSYDGKSAQSDYASATTLTNGSDSTSGIPTGLTATAVSSSIITVSWSPVSGASLYQVYRATSSSGSYYYAGGSTSTSYTDPGLSSGTTYYYKVSAYGYDGQSAQSDYVSATTFSTPDIPTGLTATAVSSGSITVSWSAVSGASGYKVYRATSSSGSYDRVGDSASTSYTDTALSSGTTYYYKVSAYNDDGESALSDYVYATTSSSSSSVPSSGSELSYSTWRNGSISSSGSALYYYFYATSGSGYTILWNDSYNGDGAKTGDVVVSAYWYSDNEPIFTRENNGYYGNGHTFTATKNGYVMLKVEPFSNSSQYSGTFAIGYQ